MISFGAKKSIITFCLIMIFGCVVICPYPTWTQPQDSKSKIQVYSSTESADTLDKSGTVVQQSKLIDAKNYELTSKVLSPSINGGEQIEREVTEKSRQLNANQIRVERLVRVPDANGKLFT